MNVRVAGPYVHVTLSKRNLLALLHKLEMPESERTLVRPTGEHMLSVAVETDEEHYGTRAIPAGPMHPDTEAFIASASELIVPEQA